MPPPPHRRNGRQQACEPCRSAKIACDHGLPTCQRCVRRSMSANCAYIDNPCNAVTQKRAAPCANPNEINLTKKVQCSPMYLDLQSSLCSQPRTAPTLPFQTQAHGPTSFSAIFFENLDELGELKIVEEREGPVLRSTSVIAEAERLLLAFPSPAQCEALLHRYFGVVHPLDPVLHEPSMRTTYMHLCETLKFAKCPSQDQAMVSFSTVTATKQSPTQSLLGPISVSDLSWNSFAVLFAVFGLAVMSLTEWDAALQLIGPDRDRKAVVKTMLDNAVASLRLAQSFTITEERISALYLAVSLRALTGCGDLIMWRMHAELVSAVTSIGLGQREPATDNTQASMLRAELRRRLFVAAFSLDKLISTHLGRPSLLSASYFASEMPLDLPDESLETSALHTLRSGSGWSLDENRLSLMTFARALFLSCRLRDRILALALGNRNPCPPELYDELRKASQATYAGLPVCLRSLQDMSALRLMQRTSIELEFLHNLFLLARLPPADQLRRSHLTEAAKALLASVLALWSKRDFLIEFQWQFDGIIVGYGIKSAGVIAMELIRQWRHDAADPEPAINRAEGIQMLALFISLLEWVRLSDGSYELCQQARVNLKKVLNSLLHHPKDLLVAPALDPQPFSPITCDPAVTMPEELLADDFPWLEDIDSWTP